MTAIQPFHRVVAAAARQSQRTPAPVAAPSYPIGARGAWDIAAALLRFHCIVPRYRVDSPRAP